MTVIDIPKAELHVHIEGTITPALARELAQRNGIVLPDEIMALEDRFHWRDFNSFLDGYDLVAASIRTPADYESVVYDYLKRSAAEGVIYVEYFASADHAEASGIGYTEMIEGMARGIDRAEADFGIVSRIIMTCVRHLGPESAVKVARMTVDNAHPYVVGFGMGGDENAFHPRDFAPAFGIVHEAGLPCTSHAGEVAGPESVAATLDHLPVVRLGHGVRSIEDLGVLQRVIDNRIVLECCPGSNIALNLYDSLEVHPFMALRQAGCLVTLNSDDPPHFATTIGQEYTQAARQWGLDRDDLLAITEVALEASFADAQTKSKLKDRLS